jgi:hypothetical protein
MSTSLVANAKKPGSQALTKREEKVTSPKYLFASAAQLLKICHDENMTIAQVIWENELAFRSPGEIKRGLMGREWSILSIP